MKIIKRILVLPVAVFAFCVDVVIGDSVTGVKTSVSDKLKEHYAMWREM